MRKKLGILGLILVVAALVIGFAVPALAHTGSTDTTSEGTAYVDNPTFTRLAETLGLTTEELVSHLQTGETLSEIADEQGVTEEQLIQVIIAPLADELDLRIKYGYITTKQAEARLEVAWEQAAAFIQRDLSGIAENGSYGHCDETGWNGMTGDWNGMMGGSYDHDGWGMMGGMMHSGYGYDYDRNTDSGSGMIDGWGQGTGNGFGGGMGGFSGMMGMR